ncbi:amidase [Enterobacterales bacterium CwR94]|nr:amidase [Enterobacterales bacterium CwR94]
MLTPHSHSLAQVESCLENAEVHRTLNAMLSLNPQVCEEARQCDREAARGQWRGPLHGIPLVVKDNIACLGLPVSCGSRGLQHLIATQDAWVVQRLRSAGALILGKTNLSEFAFDVRSRSSLGGDVRNPLDAAVTAGGSSGGSAAAVRAGIAPAALGTDTGGSIRIPAAYTGLVGLRPAFRRAWLRGVAPLSLSKDTVGPMAHSVADVARLHQVMSQQPVDPLPSVRLRGLRLGVLPALFGNDPAQRTVLDRAFSRLSQAGCALITVHLPLLEAIRQQPCASLYEFGISFQRWLSQQPSARVSLQQLVAEGNVLPEFVPFLQQHLQRQRMVERDWHAARQFHRQVKNALRALLVEHNVQGLLYPTAKALPVSLEKMPPGCAPELAAMSGWPAVTQCAGYATTGLPVGLELLMPPEHENHLLAVAQALENGLR